MSVGKLRGFLAAAFIFYLLVGAAFISSLVQLLSYLALRPFSLNTHRKVCVTFAGSFLLCSVFLLEKWAGITFKSYGDRLDPSKSYFTLVNHASDIDWLLGLAYVARFGYPYPGNAKSVVKASLGRVPLFGNILQFSEFLFLTRNWANDRERFLQALLALRGYARTAPLWFVLYPEGTRLTPEKLEYSKAFARSKNIPEPMNVLIPRYKAFTAIFATMRDQFHGVVDATFMFEKDHPSMKSTLSTQCNTVVHVHSTLTLMEDMPEGEQQLEQWLLDRWFEKDNRITLFKKDMSSLGPANDAHFPIEGSPSLLRFYALVATSLFVSIATVYISSQFPNGLYLLFLVSISATIVTGIFTIMNVKPSRKGSASSK